MRKPSAGLVVVALAVGVGGGQAFAGLARASAPRETIRLFNGTDLSGWKVFPKTAGTSAFTVESGAIRCAGEPAGYIRTEAAFRDYLLTIEWRHLAPGDAGVLLHVNGPDKTWPRSVAIRGSYGRLGDLVALGGAGFKEPAGRKDRKGELLPREEPSGELPLGEWNRLEIVCRGDRLAVYVNGRRANEVSGLADPSGAIALQSDGASWECRLVTIGPAPERELYPAAGLELFNGKDLSGWKLVAGADPSKTFTVENGLVKCSGEPAGYMRTEAEYENYMLRVEWRFLKPGNSGILVHMSPPDKVWPRSIECQGMSGNQGDFFVIDGTEFKEHKGLQDRRVAKRADSNENPIGEWNVYEVVCRGDSIRPYVNGRLMNEATECSVSKGHICIQSEGAAWECRRIALLPVPADEPSSDRGKSGPYPPAILPTAAMITGETAVTIRGAAGGEIRYTLDGSEPSKDSPLYTQPLRIRASTTVKARLFTNDGLSSPVATRKYQLLPPAPPAPSVFISDLVPEKAVAGWGGDPKMDRSIEGNPLSVGGKRYQKGIGTHAVSEIVFALKPEYKRFVAVVGNDDEASGRGGSMAYQVFADDTLLVETPVVSGNGFWHVDVRIPAGKKKLRLVVTDGGDGIGCDHGDWANAGFLVE